MAKANKDGWIRHRGGKKPFPDGTLVDVRHRDGEVCTMVPVGRGAATSWRHHKIYGDIMAYGLHKKEEENPENKIEELAKLREKYIEIMGDIKKSQEKIEEIHIEIEEMKKEAQRITGEARKLGYDFYV